MWIYLPHIQAIREVFSMELDSVHSLAYLFSDHGFLNFIEWLISVTTVTSLNVGLAHLSIQWISQVTRCLLFLSALEPWRCPVYQSYVICGILNYFTASILYLSLTYLWRMNIFLWLCDIVHRHVIRCGKYDANRHNVNWGLKWSCRKVPLFFSLCDC